jgi:hypothetical protein
MLANLVATDAMIATARDLLRIKAPRHYIEFAIRQEHRATHAQADDAVRAARINPSGN